MTTTRQELEDEARVLGCFPDPEGRTDEQLRDAISAERAAGEWIRRFEQLPSDAAKRDAIHRLALDLEKASKLDPTTPPTEGNTP
jgi:hypothetical protein